MSPEETAPDPREDAGRRRARLWDRVVEGQAAVLPAGAPEWLWEAGRREERMAALEALLPGPLERACVCLRVLGAAPQEWHVGLPLDRLVEPWLIDTLGGELMGAAIDRVIPEPLGMAGSARWLLHAGGAAHLVTHDAARYVAETARWALEHPVPRNRTETLEVLARIHSPFVVPLLHAVLAGLFTPRVASAEESELFDLFGEPGTFFVDDDHLLRGTSDRAYSALLLARRGERGIRPRILDLMDTAGREDFHALALAMEALEEAPE
ncbi:MAG: hypothetical protein IT348_15900 [Candidatus Eisenbacteria bacterium]|nr:hypothetical protein [Candidatus Eisenbacteria bacterium]